MACEKKITRGHKAKLSRAARKEFRSLMWEFRRDPKDLSAADRRRLEGLFTRLPQLRTLHELRVRFKRIFDTAPHRQAAARRLTGLFLDALEAFPELEDFVRTYERWQEQILNYFEAGQTSAAVEGINNKARVITKRAYGLKSADSLWTRLFLDLNRAKDIARYSIASLRAMANGLRGLFSMVCT
jgi:transposase